MSDLVFALIMAVLIGLFAVITIQAMPEWHPRHHVTSVNH